jgi:hypothetical protein
MNCFSCILLNIQFTLKCFQINVTDLDDIPVHFKSCANSTMSCSCKKWENLLQASYKV